ncbi:MAG: SGNH/GDSL hydrolase family protein [Chitinophagaceae bacterium]|nr:SGNH/GDSL hydrolase family protein [Chitinophagaceae bacterium]
MALKYLALGDSYTIGESVPATDNFPSQAIKMLRNSGFEFDDPLIIAKTGWTTDELADNIQRQKPHSKYDLVTLLIGVNNQYRGRSSNEYQEEFHQLLKIAIAFARKDADHVVVLSIPDWGATPFAEGRNRIQIASEIDEFNRSNKALSIQYNCHYIDITQGTREAAADRSLVASDGLHPSPKDYKRWAEKLVSVYIAEITTTHG